MYENEERTVENLRDVTLNDVGGSSIVSLYSNPTFSIYRHIQHVFFCTSSCKMSFVARNLSRAIVRRSTPMVGQTSKRGVRTVPRLGTEAEMEAEAVAQIRARLAYQKEIMVANPHKSHAEEWKELWTWIRISIFVCGPIVVFGVAKDLVMEEHHHRPHENLPEYMGIRNKEFPWECENCDLFDLSCWNKCRAEQA